MNKEEVILFLAMDVLNLNKSIDGVYSVLKDGQYENFNPYDNIEHAWLLLEFFNEGLIRKRLGGINYRAWILHKGKEYVETAFTPNEAIINTVLKVYGKEYKRIQ